MPEVTSIRITQEGSVWQCNFRGTDTDLLALLHQTFRLNRPFHRLCTEALLTFDTEAGGTIIDTITPAPEPEKEEQP